MIGMGQLAIACGWTGGHLFPGLAVAEAVRRRGHEVSFFISTKAVDCRARSGAGEVKNGVVIPAGGWRGVLGAGSFAVHFLSAVRKAGEEMRVKKVGALLGMGGFISGAASVAARLGKIPDYLHESNAITGRATRMLAKGAKKVFVGFAECEAGLGGVKGTVTGTTVRNRLGRMGKGEGVNKLGLSPHRPLVVGLGGSLGARELNDIVPRALALLPPGQQPIGTHQSGASEIDELRANYDAAGVQAALTPFIDDTAQAFAEADLVVCRAGASTVTEIAAVGAAAVFVPFPSAVDDHQTHNPRFPVPPGAGRLNRGPARAGVDQLLSQARFDPLRPVTDGAQPCRRLDRGRQAGSCAAKRRLARVAFRQGLGLNPV